MHPPRSSCQESCGRFCHINGIAGRADLVGHYADWLVVVRQTQHGFDEVAALAATAPNAVKPARANDEMLRTKRAHAEFAGQLAQAIDADWARRIGFAVRRCP